MTKEELTADVLKGFLLIVGEYRGSHAEVAGYVDKKTGEAIQHVRATHLVECAWSGRIDRVIITEYFADPIGTVEQANATFKYVRGLPRAKNAPPDIHNHPIWSDKSQLFPIPGCSTRKSFSKARLRTSSCESHGKRV